MTLHDLNELAPEQAESEFLKCCGSRRWAQAMTQARPFANADEIVVAADNIWRSLSEQDWLEAFRAHPKIGEEKAEAVQSGEAQNWSAEEQAGVTNARANTLTALAARNREYENRFGFIFIVCATGKSSEEMLTILNGRLRNDTDTEIRTAAEEQRKITRLRLERLLD